MRSRRSRCLTSLGSFCSLVENISMIAHRDAVVRSSLHRGDMTCDIWTQRCLLCSMFVLLSVCHPFLCKLTSTTRLCFSGNERVVNNYPLLLFNMPVMLKKFCRLPKFNQRLISLKCLFHTYICA
jgi:hypothetical protein